MPENLRDIRLFVAVYEERSFTAAAEREHATQSGTSQHIRKLEDRLGVRLFYRGIGVSVEPTPAAAAYYQGCLDLLRAHAKTKEIIRRFGRGMDGNLTVGLPGSIVRSSFAPAILRFMDSHPNVSIQIAEADSDGLTELVRNGRVEIAIVGGIEGEKGMRKTLFARMPEVLVSAPTSGLRHLAPQRLSSCPPLRMIIPLHSSMRRRAIEAYVAANGVQVERWLEVHSNSGALNLVANSDWVTILPMMMLLPEIDHKGLTINPLDSPPLMLDLCLLESLRSHRSPVAEEFVSILKDETERVKARLEGYLGYSL